MIRKNKVLTKSGLKPCQPPHPHPAVPDPNHPPYIPPPSRQYNSTDRHVLQGWGGLKGGGVKKIGLIIIEEGGRGEGGGRVNNGGWGGGDFPHLGRNPGGGWGRGGVALDRGLMRDIMVKG